MKNPFAQLFTGFNVVTKSSDDDKKNIRPYKVKKAVEFLSLPEIRNIDAFNTKVKFLKTRGLNEEEIMEAFRKVEKSTALRVDLHEIANDVIHGENSALSGTPDRGETSPLSSIFSFCHKILMFAGIATSCYYLYRQWLTMRTKLDKSTKEDAAIKAELREIKMQLLRIAGDLKHYQVLQENQTKLFAEINSLKAIFTSRQYFEEKKNTKLSMPSWQLNNASHSASTSEELPNITADVLSNQTNGHVDGIEPKTVPRKSKSNNTVLADATVSELADSKPVGENEIVKESNAKSPSEKKKETKKKNLKN